jgi:Casein kinase substrate phosphoprotein PP28/SAP domain
MNAESAEEIELRNNRLAEFDEIRAERRGNDSDEEELQETGEDVENKEGNGEVKIEGSDKSPAEIVESRKEREAREKAEQYRKRHEAGLTEEYRKDMEKLAEVRRRREEAAARKALDHEAEALAEENRAAKAAQFAADTQHIEEKKTSKNVKVPKISKLDSITIKKLKPNEVKDALKERGLPTVGNKKDITARLLKYESERTD